MARLPLLTLSDITLGFGGNNLLDGVDLVVKPGARMALVGRNGSGKSTLLKVMSGSIQPDHGQRAAGSADIGYMEQHPDFSGYATLGDFAAGDLPADQVYRVEQATEGLKIASGTEPARASGGERRRAALARLIVRMPDLMLLDEPTNHLDIDAIAWLENYLAQAKSAFVVISHDRMFLRTLAKTTLWLDRGTLRQRAEGFQSFEDWRDEVHAQEDLERHKLGRLIKAEAKWAVEGISARRTRNQGRVRRLQHLRAEQAGLIARPEVAKLEAKTGTASGRLVIEAEAVSKSLGGLPLIRDFSIRIKRGERLALIGPNGVGKTTLINLLLKDLAPDTGHIRHGTNLTTAVFDQNRATLDDNASLWDTLTGDRDLGISGRNDQIMVRGQPRHVVGYLKDFMFDESQARGPVRPLSGGAKARVLPALLWARESNLLVLDEPTNDLDVETLDLLQELLDDYAGTVLLVSHDRDFLDRVATTSVVMKPGAKATIYAGGWSDCRAQNAFAGGVAEKPAPRTRVKAKAKNPESQANAPVTGLSFVESHRLKALPREIDRLQAEISRLETALAEPDLYHRARKKFDAISQGLAERQEKLAAAEDEWLDLEERASGA